jgi:hypothetical protein
LLLHDRILLWSSTLLFDQLDVEPRSFVPAW